MNVNRFVISFLTLCLTACSNNSDSFKKYSFSHQQATSDYDDYMYYDDSIFEQESTVFNPQLASASISFALASFASMSTNDYKKKSQNAEQLLTKLGFTDFDTNEDYKKKPEGDTIGLLAAHKTIDEYTVVAIGIRGAAYYSEWASNFTLGNRDDGYHEGFYKAAMDYINWSKEYFVKYNISGNVKIWTAGYSRAGATCNIASGLFAEALNKGEKPFGENVILSRSHFYSYCFEAPMGAPNTKDSSGRVLVKSENYNNIFNMLNVNDPVPLVAMHELGFTRYGIDMYFPDPLTTLKYEKHFSNMKNLYESVSNHFVLGDYLISDFKYYSLSGLSKKENQNVHKMSQSLFLKEVIKDLTVEGISGNGKRTIEECLPYYANNVQTGLRNVFLILYESEAFKGSFIDVGVSLLSDLGVIEQLDSLIADLLVEGREAFIQDIRPILIRGLNRMNLGINVDETVNNLVSFIAVVADEMIMAFLKGKHYEFLNFLDKNNIKSLASGHYPELCAAHVRALDKHYVKDPYTDYDKMSGQYYRLSVYNTNTSIIIKNNGNTIVKINNGEEINNQISYIKRKNCYEIYLPYYEEYQVKLGANSEVLLDYYDTHVEEYININLGFNESNDFEIK